MKTEFNYPKFCPDAMAASLLEPRWTMPVLCEMWAGSTRLNEIQRGVTGMSPGLLSKRLKELESYGLVTRRKNDWAYRIFNDVAEPLIRSLGEWAHSNIDCTISLQNIDARLLMWNIRRKIDLLEFPKRKSVIQYILKNPPHDAKNYWLVAKPAERWIA
jgi:DNA-binding HxlR family transcriptional regulator